MRTPSSVWRASCRTTRSSCSCAWSHGYAHPPTLPILQTAADSHPCGRQTDDQYLGEKRTAVASLHSSPARASDPFSPLSIPILCPQLCVPDFVSPPQLKKKWDPFRSQEPPYAEYNFIPRLASYHMGSDAAMLGPNSTDRLKTVMVSATARICVLLEGDIWFDHWNPLSAIRVGARGCAESLNVGVWLAGASGAGRLQPDPRHRTLHHHTGRWPHPLILAPITSSSMYPLLCPSRTTSGTDTCADVCVCGSGGCQREEVLSFQQMEPFQPFTLFGTLGKPLPLLPAPLHHYTCSPPALYSVPTSRCVGRDFGHLHGLFRLDAGRAPPPAWLSSHDPLPARADRAQ